MVDLAIYDGKSVFVPGEGPVISTDLSDPPAFHGWFNDFPADKLSKLSKLCPLDMEPIPKDQVQFASAECLGQWCGAVIAAAPPATDGSTTFQQLQKEAKPVKVLGLVKGAPVAAPGGE